VSVNFTASSRGDSSGIIERKVDEFSRISSGMRFQTRPG
jgi:hypothetical protein